MCQDSKSAGVWRNSDGGQHYPGHEDTQAVPATKAGVPTRHEGLGFNLLPHRGGAEVCI